MRAITPAPVRKTFEVEAPVEIAFEVFTAQMTTWWPPQHTIGSSPIKQTVIEPKVGGRWYAIGQDGSESSHGHVLIWAPPSRLVLDWQITADWAFDPELHTEIEVNFIALAETRTRVDFEHRNLEQYGARAGAVRDQIEPGWGQILARFAEAASS